MQKYKDTIPVRKGEELSAKRLKEFLQENLFDSGISDLEIEQFGAGHSNLTYLLKSGDWEAVLRRPPHGSVASKAHDMKREYTFLKYIHNAYDVAPKPLVYSENETIVGRPFFIMERRKGIVLDTEFPPNLPYTPELGRRISALMVDKLVELHQIDYKQTNLIHLARPEGFMERQVKGWIHRYEQAKTEDIVEVKGVIDYLLAHVPESPEATIIHYDYKLNNAMFTTDFGKMTGLFDWEMSTIGDPLADVAVAMSYWIQDNDNELLKYGLGNPPVTIMDGFYTRDQFIHEYALKSVRDVSGINYYLTFAYFKLAVIGQQIYYRYKNGQTNDPRFSKLNILVKNMLQQANDSVK